MIKELKQRIAELSHENEALKAQVFNLKTDKTALKCLVAKLYQNHPVRKEPECYTNHQVKYWLDELK